MSYCLVLWIKINFLGNKGAVGVSFSFDGTSLCFVCCHLTSGHEKLVRYCNRYPLCSLLFIEICRGKWCGMLVMKRIFGYSLQLLIIISKLWQLFIIFILVILRDLLLSVKLLFCCFINMLSDETRMLVIYSRVLILVQRTVASTMPRTTSTTFSCSAIWITGWMTLNPLYVDFNFC